MMSYKQDFFIVPHLTYGNIYFLYRPLWGAGYLEIQFKIVNNNLFYNMLNKNEIDWIEENMLNNPE